MARQFNSLGKFCLLIFLIECTYSANIKPRNVRLKLSKSAKPIGTNNTKRWMPLFAVSNLNFQPSGFSGPGFFDDTDEGQQAFPGAQPDEADASFLSQINNNMIANDFERRLNGGEIQPILPNQVESFSKQMPSTMEGQVDIGGIEGINPYQDNSVINPKMMESELMGAPLQEMKSDLDSALNDKKPSNVQAFSGFNIRNPIGTTNEISNLISKIALTEDLKDFSGDSKDKEKPSPGKVSVSVPSKTSKHKGDKETIKETSDNSVTDSGIDSKEDKSQSISEKEANVVTFSKEKNTASETEEAPSETTPHSKHESKVKANKRPLVSSNKPNQENEQQQDKADDKSVALDNEDTDSLTQNAKVQNYDKKPTVKGKENKALELHESTGSSKPERDNRKTSKAKKFASENRKIHGEEQIRNDDDENNQRQMTVNFASLSHGDRPSKISSHKINFGTFDEIIKAHSKNENEHEEYKETDKGEKAAPAIGTKPKKQGKFTAADESEQDDGGSPAHHEETHAKQVQINSDDDETDSGTAGNIQQHYGNEQDESENKANENESTENTSMERMNNKHFHSQKNSLSQQQDSQNSFSQQQQRQRLETVNNKAKKMKWDTEESDHSSGHAENMEDKEDDYQENKGNENQQERIVKLKERIRMQRQSKGRDRETKNGFSRQQQHGFSRQQNGFSRQLFRENTGRARGLSNTEQSSNADGDQVDNSLASNVGQPKIPSTLAATALKQHLVTSLRHALLANVAAMVKTKAPIVPDAENMAQIPQQQQYFQKPRAQEEEKSDASEIHPEGSNRQQEMVQESISLPQKQNSQAEAGQAATGMDSSAPMQNNLEQNLMKMDKEKLVHLIANMVKHGPNQVESNRHQGGQGNQEGGNNEQSMDENKPNQETADAENDSHQNATSEEATRGEPGPDENKADAEQSKEASTDNVNQSIDSNGKQSGDNSGSQSNSDEMLHGRNETEGGYQMDDNANQNSNKQNTPDPFQEPKEQQKIVQIKEDGFKFGTQPTQEQNSEADNQNEGAAQQSPETTGSQGESNAIQPQEGVSVEIDDKGGAEHIPHQKPLAALEKVLAEQEKEKEIEHTEYQAYPVGKNKEEATYYKFRRLKNQHHLKKFANKGPEEDAYAEIGLSDPGNNDKLHHHHKSETAPGVAENLQKISEDKNIANEEGKGVGERASKTGNSPSLNEAIGAVAEQEQSNKQESDNNASTQQPLDNVASSQQAPDSDASNQEASDNDASNSAGNIVGNMQQQQQKDTTQSTVDQSEAIQANEVQPEGAESVNSTEPAESNTMQESTPAQAPENTPQNAQAESNAETQQNTEFETKINAQQVKFAGPSKDDEKQEKIAQQQQPIKTTAKSKHIIHTLNEQNISKGSDMQNAINIFNKMLKKKATGDVSGKIDDIYASIGSLDPNVKKKKTSIGKS